MSTSCNELRTGYPQPKGVLDSPRGHLRPGAYVNDNRREIRGTDAIRKFMAKEFVGDSVTMDVRESSPHD